MMVDFVARIDGLDFTEIDAALTRARAAIERGQQLSLGDLDPIALLGDLGVAVRAVAELRLDPAQLGDLGRQALAALGELIELPDLTGIEQILDGLEQLSRRLTGVVDVFGGGGSGREVLDRVFTALSGSLDVEALLGEITDQAARVFDVSVPPGLERPLRSLTALAGRPDPDELLDILGSVITGLDLAAVGRLVGSAEGTIRVVAGAGDAAPLELAIAAVRLRLDAAYTLLAVPTVDVDAVLAGIDEVGGALDAVGTALAGFEAGVATDLRTAANLLAELDLVPELDRLVAALPLPGEDLPRLLVESLEGMAEFFEQLTGPTVTAAVAAMKDELLAAAGLDRLTDLLSGLDAVFDEAGALLDRLPVRRLRDEAVSALVSAEQAVLAFDGFDFLDAAVAPVRELDVAVRSLDLSTITDAVEAVVDQLNELLGDIDIAPVRDAVDAVIEPLGEIVGELEPFAREVADQLARLVDEIDSIDFDAAGSATLDLLHGIRSQVTDAVGDGDVPEPVKAVVAGAAAVLRELDLAAQLTAPFGEAVVRIDLDALLAPITEIWDSARAALAQATPAALIAELDPPFEQLLEALNQLSLQPLIGAVQRLFDDLVAELGRLDPRRLIAPLEAQFQDVVRAVTAALDPAPIFAPLRAAYAELQGLLDRIDVRAALVSMVGGLADLPHQLTSRLGERLQAGVSAGSPAPVPVAGFQLGDVLRPLALFLQEVRERLAELAGELVAPVLAELAGVTRGLRALADPEQGFLVRLGDALDARLAWLDPRAGDGPLALLRADLESFRLAVLTVGVDAGAQVRLTAAADAVQLDARVSVSLDADLQHQSGHLRATTDSAGLGRSLRLLARALDAALPAELLTGALDPRVATEQFLDAVFERIDPTALADRLDAVGARIEGRFLALSAELADGLFQLVNDLFAGLEPLLPDAVIRRLQAGIDRVLARFAVLDPAPIEAEVRAVVTAAVSLLTLYSPAALAAELGRVFDSCIAQLRALSPQALFAGIADPFAPIRTQLAMMRPSLVLAPLVESTEEFGAALETIASIDLSFAAGIVGELEQTFTTVLDGVEQEWNALLDELAAMSGSVTVSVG